MTGHVVIRECGTIHVPQTLTAPPRDTGGQVSISAGADGTPLLASASAEVTS